MDWLFLISLQRIHGKRLVEISILIITAFVEMNRSEKHQRLTQRDRENLRQVKEFICENLSRNLSIDSIASQAGVNRYKLTYGFKEIFGESIHRFIVKERMGHAKHLLSETDMPIKKIAQLCGYSNHENFAHAFKNHFGITPSTIRK